MKLCMIGAFGHSNYVFEGLKEHPDINLSAISAGDGSQPERLKNMVGQNNYDPQIYTDWREMLDREKPDVLSVDGPFHLHAEMSLEALKRGIAVFCEKPVAFTSEELSALESASAENGNKFCAMTGLRYLPNFYQAFRMFENGDIGEPVLIQTRKSYKMATRPDYYRQRSTYGGTIGWVGSHAVDWILWFSRSSFAQVSAFQSRRFNGGYGTLESAAQCLCTMKNGVLGEISMDFLRPEQAPTWGDDRVRIVGSQGVLEAAQGELTLTDKNGENKIEVEQPDRTLFGDFIRSLKGTGSTLASAADVFEMTRACIAMQQAADEERVVKLD